MAAFDRNRWPPSVGIGGRYASDSAVTVPVAVLAVTLGRVPVAAMAVPQEPGLVAAAVLTQVCPVA